jgi:16S rRNA (cytidine1402-2'-O)-methyltransferase
MVSTPIGNLRDLTLRALDTLREVTVVVAEDTRQTRKLLSAHDIRAPLSSLHAQSSEHRLEGVVNRLSQGDDVAYVTDAGSPGVSDPGVQLADEAQRRGIPVRVIPGASSVTAALAVAGLPAAEFHFIGFLPRTPGKRLAALESALAPNHTVVLLESPQRVAKLVAELEAAAPDRTVALCRELTKVHEEVLRGTPSELAPLLADRQRGEFTVVIGPGPAEEPEEADRQQLLDRIAALQGCGLSTKQISAVIALDQGISKKQVYQLILEQQG